MASHHYSDICEKYISDLLHIFCEGRISYHEIFCLHLNGLFHLFPHLNLSWGSKSELIIFKNYLSEFENCFSIQNRKLFSHPDME